MDLKPDRAVDAAQAAAGPAETQLVYARILEWGTRAGFVALALGFAAYVLGWLPPHVPLEQLPTVWGRGLDAYLEATGLPTGWSWVPRVGEGDVANLVGIALLAGAPVLSLLAVIPLFAARRERAHLALCVLTAVVLVVAASAILSPGP